VLGLFWGEHSILIFLHEFLVDGVVSLPVQETGKIAKGTDDCALEDGGVVCVVSEIFQKSRRSIIKPGGGEVVEPSHVKDLRVQLNKGYVVVV